ncbi:MAG: hypothetical protein V3V33_00270 [Candidatus Lokiarchaeia archaeon]
MVLGIALFSWDTKVGSILEAKYPENLELSLKLTHKIFLAHSLKEDFTTQELLEINYDNQIILSVCDKSRVVEDGYEIVFLILEEKEKVNIYQIKSQMLSFGLETLKKSKVERKNYFLDNLGSFFKEVSPRKILLVGQAATGKTSIKKIVFEGASPKDLLYNPLEPTRGISPSVYSWLDLKLGLFDSSGQELSDLLGNLNESDTILAFENTDIIIYIFDYQIWISNPQQVVDDIDKILKIIKDNQFESKLVLFIHKIDLIGQETRKNSLKEITNSIKKQYKIPIYYTSIYPNLIYNLYNAFYDLLSGFSKENALIKEILDSFLLDISKTMVFVTNQSDSILVQAMSKDFNTTIINHSHKLITQLNKTFDDMALNSRIEHLILSSSNKFNLIMNNLNYEKFGLKNLICLSETLSSNKLIWLIGQVRLKLKNLYYFTKKKK